MDANTLAVVPGLTVSPGAAVSSGAARSPGAAVSPGLDTLERALMDVARRLLGRPFTTNLPSGERLDKAAYHVLSRLEESGEIRLSDLAAVAGLDVSTVSRQIRQLEDAGLVQRRADPDDKRAARIDLTAAGHTDLAAMRLERQVRLDEATTGWTRADRDELTALLQRLADQLLPGCIKNSNRANPDRPAREVATA